MLDQPFDIVNQRAISNVSSRGALILIWFLR